MDTHTLTMSLKGFGCAPTQAEVVIETLCLRRRVARSATVLVAGLVAAVIALPIPLVHFVLAPAALLIGIALGTIRLGQRVIFWSAEGSCPYCGTRQRLGLAGRAFRLPREVFCRTCARALVLGGDWQNVR